MVFEEYVLFLQTRSCSFLKVLATQEFSRQTKNLSGLKLPAATADKCRRTVNILLDRPTSLLVAGTCTT